MAENGPIESPPIKDRLTPSFVSVILVFLAGLIGVSVHLINRDGPRDNLSGSADLDVLTNDIENRNAELRRQRTLLQHELNSLSIRCPPRRIDG